MYIYRAYPSQGSFNAQEAKEFRQMLKDRPQLKKQYSDFKTEEYQRLRSRTGRSIWLDGDLDKLFEIAAISGI